MSLQKIKIIFLSVEIVTQFDAIKIREANIFIGQKIVITFVSSKDRLETSYSRKKVRQNHDSEGHFRLTRQAVNTSKKGQDDITQ